MINSMGNYNTKLKVFLFAISFLFDTSTIFCQDFYINEKSEAAYLNYVISPKWINLNINESYEFLNNSGFANIKTTSNNDKEIVSGRIPNKDYIYTRKLVFENKIIKEYSDIITFFQPCLLCLANEMKRSFKNNPMMQEINEKSYLSAIKDDNELKELFYKNHIQSLNLDGIKSELVGDISDFGFKFSNSVKTDNFNITRNCLLELDKDKIYNFISERRISINEKKYLVGDYNLNNVNQYDLNLMVNIFLIDCKNHNILVKKGKIVTSFETLDGKTLGLSYGINNDNKIELKIDPLKWENSSIPKRWYLIYHELGHDVLNLKHGNGGKMMFNFADKGYSWKEFWEDKNYMFNSYKRR